MVEIILFKVNIAYFCLGSD